MAVGVTSLIVVPYIREQTISVTATQKNGEDVFTHTSSPFFSSCDRSWDTGDDRVHGSRGPGHGASAHGWVLAQDVPIRACAQPCHSADVNVQEAVLKWLTA